MSGTWRELDWTENLSFWRIHEVEHLYITLNSLVHFKLICTCCHLQIPFGVVRMAVVVAPFLYVGTLISKQFAAILEENDIFVPDDDDD